MHWLKIGVAALGIGLVAIVALAPDTNVKSVALAGLIIPLVLYFFFRQAIYIWWYTHHATPRLDALMRQLLATQFPYYQRLSEADRARFEQRVYMVLLTKNFEKKGTQTLPEEVKGLVAASLVQLTFGWEEYLFPKFRTVALFPTAFPSPTIPVFHVSEIYDEGIYSSVIYAIPAVISGIAQPAAYYNVALHEWAAVVEAHHPELADRLAPFDTPDTHRRLEMVRQATLPQLLQNTGKPTLAFFPRCVEHFFHRPRTFRELLPELYAALTSFLRQDPLA